MGLYDHIWPAIYDHARSIHDHARDALKHSRVLTESLHHSSSFETKSGIPLSSQVFRILDAYQLFSHSICLEILRSYHFQHFLKSPHLPFILSVLQMALQTAKIFLRSLHQTLTFVWKNNTFRRNPGVLFGIPLCFPNRNKHSNICWKHGNLNPKQDDSSTPSFFKAKTLKVNTRARGNMAT